MVWPDERWMMQLMAGKKEEGTERQRSVMLIVQYIIYCTSPLTLTVRSHADLYKKRELLLLHMSFYTNQYYHVIFFPFKILLNHLSDHFVYFIWFGFDIFIQKLILNHQRGKTRSKGPLYSSPVAPCGHLLTH